MPCICIYAVRPLTSLKKREMVLLKFDQTECTLLHTGETAFLAYSIRTLPHCLCESLFHWSKASDVHSAKSMQAYVTQHLIFDWQKYHIKRQTLLRTHLASHGSFFFKHSVALDSSKKNSMFINEKGLAPKHYG